MAGVAVELLVHGIDMEESMAFGIQLFQLRAAALSQDGVTGVTVARTDRPPVRAFVISIVATEAAGPFFMTDIVGMRAPIGLHLGEKVTLENSPRGINHTFDFRIVWIALLQSITDLLERFCFRPVRRS